MSRPIITANATTSDWICNTVINLIKEADLVNLDRNVLNSEFKQGSWTIGQTHVVNNSSTISQINSGTMINNVYDFFNNTNIRSAIGISTHGLLSKKSFSLLIAYLTVYMQECIATYYHSQSNNPKYDIAYKSSSGSDNNTDTTTSNDFSSCFRKLCDACCSKNIQHVTQYHAYYKSCSSSSCSSSSSSSSSLFIAYMKV